VPRFEFRRPSSQDEFDRFYGILAESLFFPPDDIGWVKTEGEHNFRLILRDDAVVGGMTVQRMGQFFGGRSVPTGAVRCVAVRPDARSEGAAATMMRASLQELRADAIPLATLYPATQKLYRSVGYELAGTRTEWKLDSGRIEVRGRELTVRQGGLDDLPLLKELYARRMADQSGPMDRSDWMWFWVTHHGKQARPRAIYLFEGDDGAEGYAICHSEGGWSGPIAPLLVLRDHVALTLGATRRLLAFAADHRSIAEQVALFAAPMDPLFRLLPQPSFKPGTAYAWMLRLIDVPEALRQRGYGPGRSGQLELEVADDVLPANAGRWRLAVDGGSATVEPGGDGALRIDVRGLAALYSGSATTRELRAVGLVDGSDAALDLADSLFAGPGSWMGDQF
jgi:predicted acetyltransferase